VTTIFNRKVYDQTGHNKNHDRGFGRHCLRGGGRRALGVNNSFLYVGNPTANPTPTSASVNVAQGATVQLNLFLQETLNGNGSIVNGDGGLLGAGISIASPATASSTGAEKDKFHLLPREKFGHGWLVTTGATAGVVAPTRPQRWRFRFDTSRIRRANASTPDWRQADAVCRIP
jgi:hypothetical protein